MVTSNLKFVLISIFTELDFKWFYGQSTMPDECTRMEIDDWLQWTRYLCQESFNELNSLI